MSKETKKPQIDLGHCIFCGECAETCLGRAITMSREFELATYDKNQARSG